MTDAPSPRCSSGTEQPLAWHCCDDRYPWIKDIVTTSPTTIDAWRDGGIKFQPLYPRGNAQGSIDRGEIGALESNPVLFDILNNALGTMHYHRLMSALNWNGYQIVASPPAALPAGAWQPIETAPKDGTWIIARCNDGSRLYRIAWGRSHKGDMCWCSSESIISYGDGLFAPNGGWTPCPTTALPSTQQLPPDWKRAAATDRCAKCGYPLSEHGYNGACYGVCGEFVSSVTSTHEKSRG